MTIALRIEPEDQTVDPGREAVFTIHVVNQSGIVDRVALDILGQAGGWSSVQPPAVALFPGADASAILIITPPHGTPLGSVPLGVRATAETTGFVEVGEANLNVGANRTVEAELRPRTATGKRRATSVIVLHNLGNAPTKVSVVATDPDDAIVFDAPSALQIGPGMVAELPLRMRLPAREKQGATLPYQVLIEGGETGQSLDGQVRQPAKKRWPILAAVMALGLLAAAFMFLRPEDAKPLAIDAPDDTVPTLPGETTVPGQTTVPAPADAAAAAAAAAAATPGGAPPGGAVAAGGAATGVAPAGPAGPQTTLPPVGRSEITLTPQTTRAPRCPGQKGTPQQTAQRVVCAWEAGAQALQAEVNKTITDSAAKALGAIPFLGGQVAGATSPIPNGTRVGFTCGRVADGKGVASVDVVGGLVSSFARCPGGTVAAP